MLDRLARGSIAMLLLLAVLEPRPVAQSARDEWVALRTGKYDSHHTVTIDNWASAFSSAATSVDPAALDDCNYSLSQTTLLIGPGRLDHMPVPIIVTSNCSWFAWSSADWLSIWRSGPGGVTPPGVAYLTLSVDYPNLTGMTRSTVVSVGTARLTVYQSPASRAADFNTDGSVDILWHNVADGRVSAWLMRRTQLLDGMLLNPAQVADVNWSPVAIGDVDRDGTADVIWQHTDGRLAFWRMIGTSMTDGDLFAEAVADTAWKIRGLADLNQDGDMDVIWQHEADGRIAVWFMAYTPKYLFPRLLYAEPLGPGQVMDVAWRIVGTGDFNQDGWPDLVWQHQADGRIALWKMHATTLVSGALLPPGQIADTDWKIRAVGDLNGDDMPDLIWQHATTGEVVAWLMNGTTMMSSVVIGLVPDTNWRIVGPR
jgi:VCBS repeat protein